MFLSRPIRNIKRWREIQVLILRYGFDFIFNQEELREVRSFLSKNFRFIKNEYEHLSIQERLVQMLQELGPTYVKMGQILSSRRDILPEEWIKEFSKLQDDVAPFPFEQVKKVIEEEFEQPLSDIFFDFEEKPFAAASIGQVHHAILQNLEKVVVKVQRPDIIPKVQSDLVMIRELVNLIEVRTKWGKKYGVLAIFEEFSRTLLLELDYRNEAINAIRLKRSLSNMPKVYVPVIHWKHTSEKVLTMEKIEGVKVNDIPKMDHAGVDRSALADVFIRSIFRQLLVDGFFHADPHPGNLFVNLETQTLVYIDLGMMGRLMPEQRHLLADLVRSIIRKDSMDVVRLIISIGTPFEKVDEVSLRREVDHIINRYLETTLEDVSLAALFRDVLFTVFDHGIRLPSDLTMAMKTIVQGEEIARTLDPDIVIIDIARTISQQIILQMLEPAEILDRINDLIRETARISKVFPRAIESILKQIESGSLSVDIQIPEFKHIINLIVIIANRLTAGLIVAGMIIGSGVIMGIPKEQTWAFIPVLGVIGFAVSMGLGGVFVWNIIMDILSTIREDKKLR
ncbi:MAG: hypothetical protein JEZ06_23820 [Anaerolineaceae bacterium]|nr:hypothetical protein [Anaerolineaceae bacterium]